MAVNRIPWEELSRLRDGELPDPEASSLRARIEAEPELREAMELLASVEIGAAELGQELDDERADAIVAAAFAAAEREVDGSISSPAAQMSGAGPPAIARAGYGRQAPFASEEKREPGLSPRSRGAAIRSAKDGPEDSPVSKEAGEPELPQRSRGAASRSAERTPRNATRIWASRALRYGAVAALALLAFALFSDRGEVRLLAATGGPHRSLGDGEAIAPGQQLRFGDGAAALLSLPDGIVLLGQHTEVRLGDGVELIEGTLAARGASVSLRARDARVLLDGAGLFSTEPSVALDRATRHWHDEGGIMGLWRKLGPPVAGAVAGSTLTLLVLEGNAELRSGADAPIRLEAGQRVRLGGGESPAKREPARAVAAALQQEPERVEDADIASMSREELAAELQSLRTRHEELLRERSRHALAAKVEETPRHLRFGTYYRIPAEQLEADAAAGRLRLRLPHVHADPSLWRSKDELRDDLSLTPEEEEAIRGVYVDSARRIREALASLYLEIGGDPAVVGEMTAASLKQELMAKSHGDDYGHAVRTAARERAGLQPVGQGGTPLERAFRLLWQEDHRVVEEIERLLGPDRAERLLNHERMARSDSTYEVGAE